MVNRHINKKRIEHTEEKKMVKIERPWFFLILFIALDQPLVKGEKRRFSTVFYP